MDPSKLNIPANIANEFETKKVEFQKLSAEVRKLVNSQQQFEAQYHENAMVKEVRTISFELYFFFRV